MIIHDFSSLSLIIFRCQKGSQLIYNETMFSFMIQRKFQTTSRLTSPGSLIKQPLEILATPTKALLEVCACAPKSSRIFLKVSPHLKQNSGRLVLSGAVVSEDAASFGTLCGLQVHAAAHTYPPRLAEPRRPKQHNLLALVSSCACCRRPR